MSPPCEKGLRTWLLPPKSGDGIAFLHANCALHAQIAAVSPNAILSSIYVGLLDVIEAHTLAVLPVAEQSLPEFLLERYRLHARLVDAIATQDAAAALRLIAQHDATPWLTPIRDPGTANHQNITSIRVVIERPYRYAPVHHGCQHSTATVGAKVEAVELKRSCTRRCRR